MDGPCFVFVSHHFSLLLDSRYHTHPKYMPFPAKFIALRGVEEEKYTVVDISRIGKQNGAAKILEEIEISRALFEIYEGGVVCHLECHYRDILIVEQSLYTKA